MNLAPSNHAGSRAKALAVVWLVTGTSAVFWTWCFLRIGHFFQHDGLEGTAELFLLLLKPSFSLAYFALGLAAKSVAIGVGRTQVWPWLVIHNWAYPCVTIALMCCQMGRMDFAMGN